MDGERESLLRRFARGLLDLVAPPRCASCGLWLRDGSSALPDRLDVLCAECLAGLPWLPRTPGCLLCQTELNETASDGGLERCAGCASEASPLEACLASLAFRDEAARWVHRFKYPAAGLGGLDPRPAAVMRMVAREVALRAPPPVPEHTWVIPVPLHPRRLRQRGFNPAAVLAREVARSAGLSFEARRLVRLRDTPSQTGLGREARRRNLAGAFACRSLPERGSQVPQQVWLVDDVVTTGATLQSAARSLREAGAQHVLALCAARTSSSIEVRDPSG